MSKAQRNGSYHFCNLCGFHGKGNEVTYDEKFGGFVHYSCKGSAEKDLRNERRLEWEIDQAAKGASQ